MRKQNIILPMLQPMPRTILLYGLTTYIYTADLSLPIPHPHPHTVLNHPQAIRHKPYSPFPRLTTFSKKRKIWNENVLASENPNPSRKKSVFVQFYRHREYFFCVAFICRQQLRRVDRTVFGRTGKRGGWYSSTVIACYPLPQTTPLSPHIPQPPPHNLRSVPHGTTYIYIYIPHHQSTAHKIKTT